MLSNGKWVTLSEVEVRVKAFCTGSTPLTMTLTEWYPKSCLAEARSNLLHLE